MNIACPIPNNKPVQNLRKLLLCLQFHFWVNPSIIIGMDRAIGRYRGNPLNNNIKGTNKYPNNIAKHLVQRGIGFPLMCKQRSGIRWHGTIYTNSFNPTSPLIWTAEIAVTIQTLSTAYTITVRKWRNISTIKTITINILFSSRTIIDS